MAGVTAAKKRKAEKPSDEKPSKTRVIEKSAKVVSKTDAAPKVKSKSTVTKKSNGTTKKKTTAAVSPKIERKTAPRPKSKAETGLEDFEEDSDADVDGGAPLPAEDDDRTAALLAGYETSDSEDEENAASDAPAIPDSQLPAAPSAAKKKALEAAKAIKQKSTDGNEAPGVLFVGHIPHGFYEHQVKGYFSQFGDISQVRLARNRRTGAYKHYGFLEFASADVAKIVADTMNGYLMFGHILKVKVIPPDQVHPELFKGANRRFKVMPWRNIERRRLETADRERWSRRIEREEKRRKGKEAKLKELGYEFKAPALRTVEDVPVQEQEPAAIQNEADQKQLKDVSKETVTKETKVITGAEEPVVEEVTEIKKVNGKGIEKKKTKVKKVVAAA